LFRSKDDGQTWQYQERLTEANQHPAHWLRLDNGDILLTYGNRVDGERGFGFKISKDEGETWSEGALVIDDLMGDCGYPSSIQRPDGKIVTAYYASGVAAHRRYHMGTVIWNLPNY
jgi:hypothetical protein